jgi:hypothetical protein
MSIADISSNPVLPEQVAALVVKSHPEAWPAEPIIITEQER